MNYQQKKELVEQMQAVCISEPTDEQLHFMHEHAVKHEIYYSSPQRLWCTNCGCRFSVGKEIPNQYRKNGRIVKETCPRCGQRLEVCHTHRMTCKEDGYAMIADTYKDWQILRYFYCENYNYIDGYTFSSRAKITYAPSKCQTEVLRIWLNPTEKLRITQSLPLGSFPNWRRQPYSLCDWEGEPKEMKVCTANMEGSDYRREWMIKTTLPKAKILPYYRKRGVSARNITELWTDTYMEMVDKIPYSETLLKMGQIRLANLFVNKSYDAIRHEKQIRIALRHGFDFEKLHTLRDYWDYISELEELEMDITNPKYLVPSDFYKEHTRISALADRKREIEAERREREREIERAMQEELVKQNFAFRRKAYKDLVIKGGEIEITPLLTKEQYKEEGAKMHHCVGGYVASHPDALILSARINGKRIETCEVNMKTWVIVQCRAACNQTSPYHNQIIDIVNGEMGHLRKMAKMAKAS